MLKVSRGTLALLVLLAIGCPAGDGFIDNRPQTEIVELRYDGDPVTAPLLPAATYEAAARFTARQTATLAGGLLTDVEFFISNAPSSCRLTVYGEGSTDAPGAVLYSADVTATTRAGWNSHVLQGPVTVPAGDLWIGVEFAHAAPLRVIGCDAGPVVPDGDWLYSSTDGSWIPFSQRFSGDVNWNIRGTVRVVR